VTATGASSACHPLAICWISCPALHAPCTRLAGAAFGWRACRSATAPCHPPNADTRATASRSGKIFAWGILVRSRSAGVCLDLCLQSGGRSPVAGVGFASSALNRIEDDRDRGRRRSRYLHQLYRRNCFTPAPVRSGARGPRQPVEENQSTVPQSLKGSHFAEARPCFPRPIDVRHQRRKHRRRQSRPEKG